MFINFQTALGRRAYTFYRGLAICAQEPNCESTARFIHTLCKLTKYQHFFNDIGMYI